MLGVLGNAALPKAPGNAQLMFPAIVSTIVFFFFYELVIDNCLIVS